MAFMSGRALFAYNPDMFEDDDAAETEIVFEEDEEQKEDDESTQPKSAAAAGAQDADLFAGGDADEDVDFD